MQPYFRPLAVLASALAASLTHGQNDYDWDKTTPGVFGQSLDFEFRGAPSNQLLVFMLSFDGGPSPLSLFDPSDPRVVSVGRELIGGWFLVGTGPMGTGTVSIPVPANPLLQGDLVYSQTATIPGVTTIVDEISNDVRAQLGRASGSSSAPATLSFARAFASAFFNRGFNAGASDVVIAGGGNGTLTSATGLQSTEIYDFRTMTIRPGPAMTAARALNTATVLSSGEVLLIGGVNALGAVLASCELYDPATNQFSPTGSLSGPRVLHGATLLPDGRVLVAGGTNDLSSVTAAVTGVLDTAEIYNPVSRTWSPAASIGGRRLGPALTTLSTGRALVSGGVEVGFFLGIPVSAVSTTACQRYDPAGNSWSGAAAMNAGRAGHHFNQVTLNDNRVLMTGGVFVPSLLGAATAAPIAGAEVYDPGANAWTVANMSTPRSVHSATLMPDGRVVVAGGAQGTLQVPTSIATVEIFDPATNSWSAGSPLLTSRGAHAAFITADGLLLLCGGNGGAANASLASCEAYHF